MKYLVKYNGDFIECTHLTYQMLKQSGAVEVVQYEDRIQEKTNCINFEFKLEDIIKYRNRIISEWNIMTNEEIINSFDELSNIKVTKSDSVDLKRDPEIQLLKTFALEKGMFPNIDEIIKFYSQKECFGKFHHALCSNNLGVLHTRKQICIQSLEEFFEAINSQRKSHKSSKAPYYNLILIFYHLLKNETVYNERYLEILSKVIEKINPELKSNSWDSNNIKIALSAIAKYAHDNVKDTECFEPELTLIFQQYKYIIPDFEVLNSFGDITDDIDYVAAEIEYTSGQKARKKGNFQESIYSFERAKIYNPGLVDADYKISQVMHEWREKINNDNNKLHEENKFDECSKNIKYLPNIGLIREYDDELIKTYLTDKFDNLTKKADTLFDKGRELLKRKEIEESSKNISEAKIIYFYLLNQKDLIPDTRFYISNKLREIFQNYEG